MNQKLSLLFYKHAKEIKQAQQRISLENEQKRNFYIFLNTKDLLVYTLSIGRIGVEVKFSHFLIHNEICRLIKPRKGIILNKSNVISVIPELSKDMFNLVSVDNTVTPVSYGFIRKNLLANVVTLTMVNRDVCDIIVEYLFMSDKIL